MRQKRGTRDDGSASNQWHKKDLCPEDDCLAAEANEVKHLK